MISGKRLSIAVAAILVTALPAVGLGPPAAAESDDCWANGSDMVGSVCGRATFILDPGRGNSLDRSAILQRQGYYGAHGFSPNFLWYAPEGDRVVQPGDPVEWSGCTGNPPGQLCDPSVVHFRPVIAAFSDDDERGREIRLRSLTYGNGFIVLACGNFSRRPVDSPTPVISGHKFHDRDRDGVRDADEPGIAGWTMTLHRDRSDAGQGTGPVATAVTDGNGYYEFRLDGHLPGTYGVTEEDRAGWTRTAGPQRHVVNVGPGIGSHHFAGHDFGNVETVADAVKVSFAVVDPPAEMAADSETTLRVRAVLENRGPAPVVDVDDAMTVTGPADCAFRPATVAVTRRLVVGHPVEVVFETAVSCSEPSFHPFEFGNRLTVITPGVVDPDLSSNERTATATIAVIDESDVRVDATTLDCPARTYVGEHITCTVGATVSNSGDHSPADAVVTLGLTGPEDCVLTPLGSVRHGLRLAAGEPTAVSTAWDVACGRRSHHDFAATSAITLDHLHVVDPDPTDDVGEAADLVEVFEPVDLSVSDLRLTCSERHYRTDEFTCTADVAVTNAGPATAVHTVTEVALTAPADCVVDPGPAHVDRRVLDAGTTAAFAAEWVVSCAESRRHAFTVTARTAADEPHPEDTDRGNDERSVSWQPVDAKPRSFPSSINLRKEGLVPFAVLSTAEFDAVAGIDQASLTFGATGTEPSVVRCAAGGEDVDDDGLADLVCHADIHRMGLTCDTTTVTVLGLTLDGRRVEGQDDVRVTGC